MSPSNRGSGGSEAVSGAVRSLKRSAASAELPAVGRAEGAARGADCGTCGAGAAGETGSGGGPVTSRLTS